MLVEVQVGVRVLEVTRGDKRLDQATKLEASLPRQLESHFR
jgi:hypothetical protein